MKKLSEVAVDVADDQMEGAEIDNEKEGTLEETEEAEEAEEADEETDEVKLAVKAAADLPPGFVEWEAVSQPTSRQGQG